MELNWNVSYAPLGRTLTHCCTLSYCSPRQATFPWCSHPCQGLSKALAVRGRRWYKSLTAAGLSHCWALCQSTVTDGGIYPAGAFILQDPDRSPLGQTHGWSLWQQQRSRVIKLLPIACEVALVCIISAFYIRKIPVGRWGRACSCSLCFPFCQFPVPVRGPAQLWLPGQIRRGKRWPQRRCWVCLALPIQLS